jgi:AraC-like DNA-binding protein
MPSSVVRTFADPDHYAASVRGGKTEITITGSGGFIAKVITIHLHHLWMQRFSDNLPRIAHAADIAEEAAISFRTQPGPPLLRSALEMLPSNIIRRSNGNDFFQSSAGLASFGSISLPVEEMTAVAAIVGRDLTPPKDALTVTPSPAAMAKLQRLHAAAGLLAEDAPAVIAQPEAARGLEQALIETMVSCLCPDEVGEDRSALRKHAAIMRRFYRVVEEKPEDALFIPELCVAIGASERTLRICCQEQLGMSPKRYLMLRRMHLVRRGLRARAPTATTVTEVAAQYGFWQFGRFAGEYKLLFGELPSTTLARSSG